MDIDGGIGVLFNYSGKGRRELPNSRVQLDGQVEVLAPDGSFLGRHIRTTLPGAVLQINAFNFPVWGALENLRPPSSPGCPRSSSPPPRGRTSPGMVRIAEAGLLPGSVQFIAGPLTTSRSHTARRRRRRSPVPPLPRPGCAPTRPSERRVRLLETDSINASVLGPDAAPAPQIRCLRARARDRDDVKAGQKCTAIRRALVPGSSSNLIDAVRAGSK